MSDYPTSQGLAGGAIPVQSTVNGAFVSLSNPLPVTVSTSTSTTATPYFQIATASGSTPANAKSLSFYLASGTASIISPQGTQVLSVGDVITFEATGGLYAALSYTVGASSALYVQGVY